MTVTAGPFALSSERLLILGAFAIALLVGWLLGRRDDVRVEPGLTAMLVIGFIAARLVFVLLYLEDYLVRPLSIMDIRDGGFHVGAGVTVALLTGLYRGWRHSEQRIPMAAAVVAGAAAWAAGTLLIIQNEEPRPPLPPIMLTTLDGDSINLHALNDRPMVVNLWATWCLPCRREMPVLEAAQQRDGGIQYVFINQAEPVEKIRDYLADEGLHLDNILLDATAVSARLLDTRGLPSTYFFDAEGNMVSMHVGELSRATLNQQLRKLR